MKIRISKLSLLVLFGAMFFSCEKENLSPENKNMQQVNQKSITSDMQQENQKFSTLSNVSK